MRQSWTHGRSKNTTRRKWERAEETGRGARAQHRRHVPHEAGNAPRVAQADEPAGKDEGESEGGGRETANAVSTGNGTGEASISSTIGSAHDQAAYPHTFACAPARANRVCKARIHGVRFPFLTDRPNAPTGEKKTAGHHGCVPCGCRVVSAHASSCNRGRRKNDGVSDPRTF